MGTIGGGPFAWAVIALYLLGAAAAVSAGSRVFDRAGRVPERRRRREARPIWLGIALVLVLGAIDRRAGPLSALVDALRDAAHAGGWYDDRRPLQAGFILGVLIVGGVAVPALRAAAGRAGRPVAAAALATATLAAFLVVRATSLHQVDAVLRERVLGLSLFTLPEVAAIGVILLASLAERRTIGRRRGRATERAGP